jgi:hypothetical protein
MFELKDNKEYKVQEYGKEYTVIDYMYETRWLHRDKLHRDYGPAVEKYDNVKLWYKYGVPHRDDGYVAIKRNEETFYFLNSKRKSFYDLLFYEETERDVK